MQKIITFYCENNQKPTDLPEIKDIWWQVPAVTRVLSETMSKDKAEGLAKWRESVGEEEANRIVKESIERGKAFDAAISKYKSDGVSGIDYIDNYFKGKTLESLQLGFICILDYMDIEGKQIPIGYKGFIDFIMDADFLVDTKTWGKHKLDKDGRPRPEWVDRDYYLQVCAYAKSLNLNKAMVLGSDGHSFQSFPVFNIENYYKEFETRLMSYIIKTKGNYFSK